MEAVEDSLFAPVPTELGACQSALLEMRAAYTEMKRQRDALRGAVDSIASIAATATRAPGRTP